MSVKATRVLTKLVSVIRSHDDEFPIQRLEVFLFVAQRGQVTRGDVVKSLGQAAGSAYRNLIALTEGEYRINKYTYEGLGWLRRFHDESNPARPWVWEVSPKGERVLNQLEDILHG